MVAFPGAPWAKCTHSYAGWVPNVRTHLSFSLIGTAVDAVSITRPFKERPRRLVLVLQKRLCNDYPEYDWNARLRPGLVHHWLLVGETREASVPVLESGNSKVGQSGFLATEADRQGMLVGKVFAMPHQDEADWAVEQSDALKTIRDAIRVYPDLERTDLRNAPPAAVDTRLRELRRDVIHEARRSENLVEIRFALLRTGELRLWYARPFSTDVEVLRVVAEQAYFFVKDVVHAHQHHDPTSDQITPLVPATQALHSGDMAWRRETLWSLSREVELLNRGRGLLAQRRSLGFIAYAEAFQNYLMGHVRNADDPSKFEPAPAVHTYDFAHLKDSIKVEVDVETQARSQSAQRTIAGSAAFIAASSLSTALTSAHNTYAKAEDSPNPDLAGFYVPEAVRFAVTNPFLSGLVAGLLVFYLVTYHYSDGDAGLFNTSQRIIAQTLRATAVSLTGSDRLQVDLDSLFHMLVILMFLGLALLPYALLYYFM